MDDAFTPAPRDPPDELPEPLRRLCVDLRPEDAALVAERFRARWPQYRYERELAAGRLPPPLAGPREPEPWGTNPYVLDAQIARLSALVAATADAATAATADDQRRDLAERLHALRRRRALAELPDQWISGKVPSRSQVSEEVHASAMALARSGAPPWQVCHHLREAVGFPPDHHIKLIACLRTVFGLGIGEGKAMAAYCPADPAREPGADEARYMREAWATVAPVIAGDVPHRGGTTYIACSPEWHPGMRAGRPVEEDDDD